MRKHLITFACVCIAFLLFIPLHLTAGDQTQNQNNAADRASREDDLSPELERILDELDNANEDFEDLTARVNYTRRIPMLDEEEKAKGELRFSKPDLVHLKLGEPRHEEVYSDGNTWWIIGHENKQVEIYESARQNQSVAEASFLTFGYGKSSDALLEDYEIQIIDTNNDDEDDGNRKTWLLSFTPRDEEAPARFSRVDVEISNKLWLPETLILHESDGEIVHRFGLHEIALNSNLEDSIFQYEPEDGYSIVQPQ